MFVGIVVGGLSMGYLMDYYGRKATAVYIRSFLGILSAICMIGAKFLMSIELYVIGHFLAGIICSLKVVLFIYVAECAPDNRRGISSMTIGSGSALIMLAIQPLCLPNVFGNESRWTGLPAVCLIMAVIHFLIGALFPQSPKHLYITEHKKDEAVASIRFYHGSEVDIDLIEEEYEGEKAIMSQGHISLKQVWDNPTLRWSLLICLLNLPALSSSLGIVGSLGGSLAIMLGLLNMTPIMISELCPHVARAPIGQVG
uniref:Major facilitator superfamily (MFS) profile domain-containing protein n=1 Tax=Panagrolaimus sp. JU765 TaxID=591449 RepID=A0AC34QNX6_9BILA